MPEDARVQIFWNEVPLIDAGFASQFIECQRGVVVVEQWPAPSQTVGGILIPDEMRSAYRNRPDIGTVLSADLSTGLLPGDYVIFAHAHGKRVSGFEAGKYYAGGEVRIFGRRQHGNGDVNYMRWDRSILARVTNMEGGIESAKFRPVQDWVLVKRDDLTEGTASGILLPDNEKHRSTKGEVVAVGERVKEVKPGDRILYTATAVKSADPIRPLCGPSMQDKNLALMKEAAILCVVHGEKVTA